MVQATSPIVATCLAHAERARTEARTATSPDDQRSWLALEAGWVRLAESYSFTRRLGDFIGAGDRTAGRVAKTQSAYCIAIVDDDPFVRTALESLVRSCGFDARCCATGREFLESISSGLPECLILDVNMPEMTGYELLAELSRGGSSIPTIMITGNHSEQGRERALAAGAAEYLRKPIGSDTLLRAIQRTMGR